jgi:hypothetical protein
LMTIDIPQDILFDECMRVCRVMPCASCVLLLPPSAALSLTLQLSKRCTRS